MEDQNSKPVTEAICLERRANLNLSETQIEEIAERAANKAVNKITSEAYQAIGKTVVSKFIWIVGVLSTAALLFATSKGWIKL